MASVKIEALIKGSTTALSGVAIAYTVNGVSATGTTDSNGILSISGLPAGSYTFKGTLSGYDSGSATLSCDGSSDATVELEMTQQSLLEMLKSAAIPEILEFIASDYASLMAQINVLAADKVSELEAEESTTTSTWVKNTRNPLEIILLQSLVITASTIGGTYVTKLITKLKSLI